MLPHITRRSLVTESPLPTAGAIPPRAGFTHAFSNGADFVLAGMFDRQIAEDVAIAKEVLSKVQRPYPWRV